jgi:hypothetical protein
MDDRLPLALKIKVKRNGSKEGKALIDALKNRFDKEIVDLIHEYLDTQDSQLYIPLMIYYEDFVASAPEDGPISSLSLEKEDHQDQNPKPDDIPF